MKLITREQWGSRATSPPTNITPERGGVTVHSVWRPNWTDPRYANSRPRPRLPMDR